MGYIATSAYIYEDYFGLSAQSYSYFFAANALLTLFGHKAFLDQFVSRGEVVGAGPFTDPGGGNMALFRSRAVAEAFVNALHISASSLKIC